MPIQDAQKPNNDPNKQNPKNSSPLIAGLLRIYWLFGWILPVLIIAKIISYPDTSPVFYVTWPLLGASMIFARYLDIFKYNGETADGEPATKRDFYWYYAMVGLIMLGLIFISIIIRMY
jgi:hypothetical protein